MASRNATLAKLAQQVDALAARLKPDSVCIEIPEAMRPLEDAIVERHYQMFPESRGAKTTLLIMRFGDIDPADLSAQPHSKSGAAWRAIANEQGQVAALAFWEVPTGTLPQ